MCFSTIVQEFAVASSAFLRASDTSCNFEETTSRYNGETNRTQDSSINIEETVEGPNDREDHIDLLVAMIQYEFDHQHIISSVSTGESENQRSICEAADLLDPIRQSLQRSGLSRPAPRTYYLSLWYRMAMETHRSERYKRRHQLSTRKP